MSESFWMTSDIISLADGTGCDVGMTWTLLVFGSELVFGSTLGVDVFCSSITVVEDLALGFLLRCGERYIPGKLASPPSTITSSSAKLTGATFRLILLLYFGIFLEEKIYNNNITYSVKTHTKWTSQNWHYHFWNCSLYTSKQVSSTSYCGKKYFHVRICYILRIY